MGLNDFMTTDYDDELEELANTIDNLLNNDNWRDGKQAGDVVEVVNRVLEQLEDMQDENMQDRDLPAEITSIDQIRQNQQIRRAKSEHKERNTVQNHCHRNLFDEERAPIGMKDKPQYNVLFDLLIQKVHLVQSIGMSIEKAEAISDTRWDALCELEKYDLKVLMKKNQRLKEEE